MTPEQLASIKLAEIDFQKFLRENDIKLEEIAAGDRNSARDMNKMTRSNVPAVLTMLITAGFFGVLGWMLYNPIAADSPPLLIMLGQLGTAWAWPALSGLALHRAALKKISYLRRRSQSKPCAGH